MDNEEVVGGHWADFAACRDHDKAVFYPPYNSDGRPTDYRAARAICARCEVREECLEDALKHETSGRFGMWGGLAPEEREDEKAARRREARRAS